MIVDDHILFSLLTGHVPEDLGLVDDGLLTRDLYTTNYFYFRMCQALLSGAEKGAFSGLMAALPEQVQRDIIRLVAVLPPAIRTLPLRDLTPTMAELSAAGISGLLRIEVLAAALHLGSEIVFSGSNDSRSFRDAANLVGVPYRVVAVDLIE